MFIHLGPKKFCNYPKYWDIQTRVNIVDPDQVLQDVTTDATSDQGLHCLPFFQQILDTSSGSKMDLFNF